MVSEREMVVVVVIKVDGKIVVTMMKWMEMVWCRHVELWYRKCSLQTVVEEAIEV